MSVNSRSLYFLGSAIFNIIRGKAPSYLLELFNRHVPSQRPSRQSVPNAFAVPSCRTSTYQNSFHPAVVYFWHSLPVDSAHTISVLKIRLFEHLFALEGNES